MYKKLEMSVLIALIITISLSCLNFSAECATIRDKVFRLHILANSDSYYDQSLKLKVRDRLLEEGLDIFGKSENINQTIEFANDNLEEFKRIAKDELIKNGCNYSVSVSVSDDYFNTRTYDKTTLPAGVYKALQVKIGKSEGHNWWCVMYPSLCLPTSTQKVDDVLNEKETDDVSNNNRYIVKFKIVEVFEKIKSFF